AGVVDHHDLGVRGESTDLLVGLLEGLRSIPGRDTDADQRRSVGLFGRGVTNPIDNNVGHVAMTPIKQKPGASRSQPRAVELSARQAPPPGPPAAEPGS